jgi:glyoxylase-like metal-dependent hydrolase (beta-lactamase superfamily II)
MAQYMASLRLLENEWGQTAVIYGGHGPEITRPLEKIGEYINHRLSRQQQLLGALERGPSTIGEIVARIYTDVDKRLWPAAGRQVLAYLLMLEREGVVSAADSDETETDSILNPTGVPIDPVAAAELGISNQETGKPEKTKKYALVKA